MKIIKETSRNVGNLHDYKGICNACGVELEYEGDLLVVEISDLEDETRKLYVPVDMLSCPSCYQKIELIRIWKNMEVSSELMGAKK